MKKIFYLIPLLMLACSLTAQTPQDTRAALDRSKPAQLSLPPTAESLTCTVNAVQSLNLRADAGTSAAVIAILNNGETVTILPHPAQGAWIKVQAQGFTGWINSTFCTKGNN